MPANCLAPISKCTYKKAQQQNKKEAFRDGDFALKKTFKRVNISPPLKYWRIFIQFSYTYSVLTSARDMIALFK